MNLAVVRTERKFCNIIDTVNAAYADEDPQSDIGDQLKEGYIKLAADLGCKSGQLKVSK